MLNNATGFRKIYIAAGYTDLRRGIDGLASIIKFNFQLDPYEKDILIKFNFQLDPYEKDILFLFCGRRSDRIKGLVWEGFVLIYKRLSVRGGYQWPRKQSEVRNLSWREFDWLMSGIDIEGLILTSPKPSKQSKKSSGFQQKSCTEKSENPL